MGVTFRRHEETFQDTGMFCVLTWALGAFTRGMFSELNADVFCVSDNFRKKRKTDQFKDCGFGPHPGETPSDPL